MALFQQLEEELKNRAAKKSRADRAAVLKGS